MHSHVLVLKLQLLKIALFFLPVRNNSNGFFVLISSLSLLMFLILFFFFFFPRGEQDSKRKQIWRNIYWLFIFSIILLKYSLTWIFFKLFFFKSFLLKKKVQLLFFSQPWPLDNSLWSQCQCHSGFRNACNSFL